MHIIDGRALAARIQQEVKERVDRLGIKPRLGVLLVGDDPASVLYVSLKKNRAEEVGIDVDLQHPPATTPDDELVNIIQRWSGDSSVHGILLQLPLPDGHDTDRVLAAIPANKDVDGFLPNSACIPPVHEGILRLINETPLRLNGSRAALIVNSEIFSAPLERLLKIGGVRVVTMKPDTLDAEALREADLVIIAVGRPRFLRADMTKQDAVIIDVGTNKTPDGKTVGDVDLDSYTNTDAWITPVPGGVGPMTIAQMLKNVCTLAENE